MTQNIDKAKQFGGDFSGQQGPQGQGYYPQQGSGPLPQGLYPAMQPPGYMQFPAQASQQGSPPLYKEQQYPQGQMPGPYFSGPQQNVGVPPYAQQPQQQNMPIGANASYYGAVPQNQYGNPVGPGGPEEDKGLGSTVIGGAAGGYAGHKLGGGLLGSAAGAVLGAIGMNAATHQINGNGHDDKKKHKKSKCWKRRHGCHNRHRRYSSSSSSSG